MQINNNNNTHFVDAICKQSILNSILKRLFCRWRFEQKKNKQQQQIQI